jgi:hypothetical protein
VGGFSGTCARRTGAAHKIPRATIGQAFRKCFITGIFPDVARGVNIHLFPNFASGMIIKH